MAIKWDDDGNGITYQGDSGRLVISDLAVGENYTIYLAIQNSKRKIVGAEQYVITGGLEEVEIFIPASLLDKCTVPLNQEYEDYYYFLKACKQADENGNVIEDTLLINGSTFGDKKILRVYPKGVEGVTNG